MCRRKVMWIIRRKIFTVVTLSGPKKSSPPSEGGVAAASADGVVLFNKRNPKLKVSPHERRRELPGLEDSATPPSGRGSFFVDEFSTRQFYCRGLMAVTLDWSPTTNAHRRQPASRH